MIPKKKRTSLDTEGLINGLIKTPKNNHLHTINNKGSGSGSENLTLEPVNEIGSGSHVSIHVTPDPLTLGSGKEVQKLINEVSDPTKIHVDRRDINDLLKEFPSASHEIIEEIFSNVNFFRRKGELRDSLGRIGNKYFFSQKIKRSYSLIDPNFSRTNIKIKGFRYFESLKKPKSDLIKHLIPRKSLIMVYSPPKSFKSLFELAKCVCLASGKDFLGFKTKKTPCLYIDLENNEQIIRERWIKLRRFFGVRKKDCPLFIISRGQEINILNTKFYEELQSLILENQIGYVVIDTLPKATNYDSNKENEVNMLYNLFFQPLIESTGCSVSFLLHTTKTKTSFMGSQAYLGAVDCSFSMKKSHDLVNIVSDNRGQNIRLGIKFLFTEDKIRLELRDYQHKTSVKNKLQALIEEMRIIKQKNPKLSNKELKEKLMKLGFEFSESTFKRGLRKMKGGGLLDDRR